MSSSDIFIPHCQPLADHKNVAAVHWNVFKLCFHTTLSAAGRPQKRCSHAVECISVTFSYQSSSCCSATKTLQPCSASISGLFCGPDATQIVRCTFPSVSLKTLQPCNQSDVLLLETSVAKCSVRLQPAAHDADCTDLFFRWNHWPELAYDAQP